MKIVSLQFIIMALIFNGCTSIPCCNRNKVYFKRGIDFSKNYLNVKGLYCIDNINDTITNGKTGYVSGFLYNRLTGEKLNGVVNVISAKDTIGLIIRNNGYFLIELPEGEYILDVTDVGFTNIKTKKFLLKKSNNIKFNFYLGTLIQH